MDSPKEVSPGPAKGPYTPGDGALDAPAVG